MALINIEIKPPQKENDLVKKVVEKVHEYGIVNNSIISCFDPECVRRVKEIDKNVKTALLYEENELGKFSPHELGRTLIIFYLRGISTPKGQEIIETYLKENINK